LKGRENERPLRTDHGRRKANSPEHGNQKMNWVPMAACKDTRKISLSERSKREGGGRSYKTLKSQERSRKKVGEWGEKKKEEDTAAEKSEI